MKNMIMAMGTVLCLTLAALPLTVSAQGSTQTAPPSAPPTRCIVPAKAGGGFDLTCQLARNAWQPELAMAYQPGGIGALVYRELTRPAPANQLNGRQDAGREPSRDPALVAWSSGTLLNLAQGRFGRYEPGMLHWVAALALDHGVVAVHRDAPWRDLPALLAALKANPSAVSFAAGGTIGSQDWMKAALLARAAGVSHKAMRVVAFEGGGDAVQALKGRHAQVLCGDAAELTRQLREGVPLRVLAVLSDHRLSGPLAGVPTAREQGIDVAWPILRGVYAGPLTSASTAADWGGQLSAHAARPDTLASMRQLGLEPLALAGPALAERVEAEIVRWRALAREFGLVASTP